MGPEEKAKVWKEFMASPLAQQVYTTYYYDKYEPDGNEEYVKRHSIEAIVHTSEMMNLLVHAYEARTLAEKPKEESQMGPTWLCEECQQQWVAQEGNRQMEAQEAPKWLDEPNHPKDGSGKWYWVQLDPLDKPGVYLVYWTTSHEWVLRVPGQGQFSLRGKKVAPIQEPS